MISYATTPAYDRCGPLAPPTGYVPDFPTPGDSLGSGGLGTDLAAVRVTPSGRPCRRSAPPS
jgi:hypothetical protein